MMYPFLAGFPVVSACALRCGIGSGGAGGALPHSADSVTRRGVRVGLQVRADYHGPAGAGKSTTARIQEHVHARGKSLHVINLDPQRRDYELRSTSATSSWKTPLKWAWVPTAVSCFACSTSRTTLSGSKTASTFGDCYLIHCRARSSCTLRARHAASVRPGHWGFRVCGTMDAMFLTDAKVYQRCQRQCAACPAPAAPHQRHHQVRYCSIRTHRGVLTPASGCWAISTSTLPRSFVR